MEWWLILILIFGGLMVFLVSGLPVAFSFLLVNLIWAYILWGGLSGLNQIILGMASSIATFSLLPVPLYILMGELLFRSGVGFRAINALDSWLGNMPGRLSLLTVGAGTLFATISGMSMASAAVLGEVLLPEMERRGYKKSMTLGPILGSGGLAIMIPPSSLAVILAWLGQFSIGKFLIAIIIPGLIMAAIYALYVITRCYLQPNLAPYYAAEAANFRQRVVLSTKYVLPLAIIIFLVTGIIFMGIATPSEAAATGAIGALILTFLYQGGSKWKIIKESFQAATGISVFILLIVTGSTAFSQILAFSGGAAGLSQIVFNLPVPPIVLVILMQVIGLILGCFMDQVAIMMITIPIFMPIVKGLGFDPIWFGAIFLLNMEVATISPPFGMTLFAMKGVATKDTTMGDIYKAALPFVAIDITIMALLLFVPSLILWLPDLMTQ